MVGTMEPGEGLLESQSAGSLGAPPQTAFQHLSERRSFSVIELRPGGKCLGLCFGAAKQSQLRHLLSATFLVSESECSLAAKFLVRPGRFHLLLRAKPVPSCPQALI